jgi:hypothetical protein
MRVERKQDLAVYYFIVNLFSGNPQIKVVDEFPVSKLTLPTVSVEAKSIDAFDFELGNRSRAKLRIWYIDVFAQNKSQRDEIAYTILDALEECIPVDNYDEGFPPTVVTRLGCMDTQDLRLDIIRIDPELVSTLYYRAMVSFSAIYNQI